VCVRIVLVNFSEDTAICQGESIQIGDSIFTETGIYLVTFSNQYNSDSLVNLNLIVNLNPIVLLGNDTIISTLDTILIDAGGGFLSYDWSNGETTQTILIDSLNGIGQHIFYVFVTDQNNCSGSDTINITIEKSTNIISMSEIEGLIKLYPNPTNGQLTVEIGNINEEIILVHIILILIDLFL
jgi:hypothetical protein